MAFSDQSRILGAGKYKNYSEVLFQQDKKVLDAEINLVQKVINERTKELMRHGLKYDSGFIKTSSFTAGSSATSFKMGSLPADINRVHINGYVIDILGTASTNDYENIIEMPVKPISGTRNDLVFIEVWESILEYNKDTSNNVNKPSASTIYKYGNTLYGGTNVNDELRDLNLGVDTADRVQIQYEIRVVENATSLIGTTCKDGTATFSQAVDPVTGETLNGLYEAHGTNNQYARQETDENNNPLGFGYHWAIPIAVVPRDSVEVAINVGGITDSRMLVGVTKLDPDADYTINKLIANSDIEVGGDLYPSSSSGHTLGKPGFTWDALYLSSKIFYNTDLIFDSAGEKIYFKTDGKIGINTDPSSQFEIYDPSIAHVKVQGFNSSTTLFSGGEGSRLQLTNLDSSSGNYSIVKFSNSFGNDVSGIASINLNHSTNEGDLAFATRPGSGSLTEFMRLKSDGKLGLSTPDPIQLLDVRGSSYISGKLGIGTDASTVNSLTVKSDNGILGFTLQNTSYHSIAEFWPDSNGHGAFTLRLDDSTKNVELRADGSSYFKGGNLGVATTNPTETFEVAGDAKVNDLIIGSTPVRIKEDSGEVQFRNYADTSFANLRLANLYVTETLTTEQYQEVLIGDNEIQLNSLITTDASNSDAGIRIKLLDDHTTRTVQSMTVATNTIVVDVLGGIISDDFIQITSSVNGNDGQYKVVSTSGVGPYNIIIDNTFKVLTADEGSGANVGREIGARIRYANTDEKFVVERIDGSQTDFQVQGNIFGKADDTSTLGTPDNRWATLYMASVVDYATNLTFVNASEKMRLTSSGWLGIGTNSPLDIVHAYGTAGTTTQITAQNTNTAGAGSLQAKSDLGGVVIQSIGSTNALGSSFQGFGRLRSEGTLNGLYLSTGAGSLILSPTDVEAMRVLPDGRIGMGTSNPTVDFELVRASNPIFKITNDSTVDHSLVLQETDSGSFIGGYNSSNVQQFALRAYGVSYFNAGNFGIGTDTPLNPLHVIGKIYASGDIETAGNFISNNDVSSSSFSTSRIRLSADDIYEYYTNGDTGTVWINRKGYLDGITKFRDFKVADGKGNTLLSVIGSTQDVSTTGNLGIGTTVIHPSPFNSFGGLHIKRGFLTDLLVEGSAAAYLHLYDSGGAANQKIFELVTSGEKTKLRAVNDASLAETFNFLTLDHANGNIGMGTTLPDYKLDVVGDLNITGTFRVNGTPFGSLWTLSGGYLYYNGGNVGIGTDVPIRQEEVYGSSVTIGDSRANVAFSDSAGYAAGVGGGLIFVGHYSSGGNRTAFGGIWAEKENGTDGNYDGQLHLGARRNAGAISSDIVIDSKGYVGFGTVTPFTPVDINKMNGNTVAKFGTGVGGDLYFVANDPIIGFNTYYNAGWKFGKGSSSDYAGTFYCDPTNGNFNWGVSTSAGNADAAATINTRMWLETSGLYINNSVGSTRIALTPDGDGYINPDANRYMKIGRATVGYCGHNDYAAFAHVDHNNTANYAMIQSSLGETYINSAPGYPIRFRINNVDIANISASGLSVTSGSISGANVTSGNNPGHTHSGLYDNYGDWNLFVNGTKQLDVTSGANVGWTAGSNVTLGYGSNTVTINAGNANWDTAYTHTLSFSNPHNVTYTQVGAAPASHDHNTLYYTKTESNANYVNVSGDTMSGRLNFNNYGLGIVGTYSSTRYQLVWSMGSAYVPSTDGTSTGTTYGLLWTHSNVGGESKSGLGHQLLIQTAGQTRTAIGDGIWTNYNITTTLYGSANLWKTGYDHSQITTGNPHNLNYVDVGAASSSHNHTYNVNDSWLRENGDNTNVKLYGNSRQMAFRTDGVTEYVSGIGGYPFVWMYGGDASGNRRMLLDSSGNIWTNTYGWLHSYFALSSHSHSGETWNNLRLTYLNIIGANGNGVRFYGADSYKIHMGYGTEYTHGTVTSYAIKMNMSNSSDRGWVWGVSGSAPVASIGTTGYMKINGEMTATYFNGLASRAKYADLAEHFMFEGEPIEPGTVVEFCGKRKLRIATKDMGICAGVISTKPGMELGHESKEFNNAPTVLMGLAGTIPVKVVGNVKMNDLLVSAGNGFARSFSENDEKLLPMRVLGIAQENKNSDSDTILMLIKNI